MRQNDGMRFENSVFDLVSALVQTNQFLLSEPNVKVCKKPKYYSKDRDSFIECDITVEKYLFDIIEHPNLPPSIIVVIECKDYSDAIGVGKIEEFHSKLQQIGADNTKGILITSRGKFQKSALKYAESKGIALARILPDEQVKYIQYELAKRPPMVLPALNTIRALTEKGFQSDDGESFYASTGEMSLGEWIRNNIGV